MGGSRGGQGVKSFLSNTGLDSQGIRQNTFPRNVRTRLCVIKPFHEAGPRFSAFQFNLETKLK